MYCTQIANFNISLLSQTAPSISDFGWPWTAGGSLEILRVMDLILAEPITSGHFRYTGHEFQSSVAHEHFPRPTIPDLLVLLEYVAVPIYTAKGKLAKKQPVHEDRSAAFYTSACQHYGLQSYKIKDKAKTCLMDAINAAPKRNLKVPQPILALEKDLKKDFVKQNKELIKNRQQETKALEKAKELSAKPCRQEAANEERGASCKEGTYRKEGAC